MWHVVVAAKLVGVFAYCALTGYALLRLATFLQRQEHDLHYRRSPGVDHSRRMDCI
jgi:hypothetical protein